MFAIIGGSGLTQLSSLEILRREVVRTPYGEPSGALTFGRLRDKDVVFLARHGYGHTIPPHEVNYQANIWALREAGVSSIVSVASVGGIRPDFVPGALVVPDQILDYTWGRKQSFFEGGETGVRHIDFTHPYDGPLRQKILAAGDDAANPAVHRVLRRVRGEGADVAGAHLAAGRPRRGAYRRLGDPGGDHAEDGDLRFPAFQSADCP